MKQISRQEEDSEDDSSSGGESYPDDSSSSEGEEDDDDDDSEEDSDAGSEESHNDDGSVGSEEDWDLVDNPIDEVEGSQENSDDDDDQDWNDVGDNSDSDRADGESSTQQDDENTNAPDDSAYFSHGDQTEDDQSSRQSDNDWDSKQDDYSDQAPDSSRVSMESDDEENDNSDDDSDRGSDDSDEPDSARFSTASGEDNQSDAGDSQEYEDYGTEDGDPTIESMGFPAASLGPNTESDDENDEIDSEAGYRQGIQSSELEDDSEESEGSEEEDSENEEHSQQWTEDFDQVYGTKQYGDDDSEGGETRDTALYTAATDDCVDFRRKPNDDDKPVLVEPMATQAVKNSSSDEHDDDESETFHMEEWGENKIDQFSYESDDSAEDHVTRGAPPETFEDEPMERDEEHGVQPQRSGNWSDSDKGGSDDENPTTTSRFAERSFDDSDDDEDSQTKQDRGSGDRFEDEPNTIDPFDPFGVSKDRDNDTEGLLPSDGPDDHAPKLWGGAYRNRLHAAICCLYLIAVGVVILLRRRKGDDEMESAMPSLPPTAAPVAYADTIIFPAIADTCLRSGNFADTAFGSSDIFQIQNGGSDDGDISFALLQFDMVGLPPNNIFQEQQLFLRLQHLDSTKKHEITVLRLPLDSEVNIQYLTWNSFDPPLGEVGPTFGVTPSSTVVDVDITSLVGTSSSSLRGGRYLQPDSLFIMLESSGSVDAVSTFRSREDASSVMRPQIIYNSVAQTLQTPPPVTTTAPSITPSPTETLSQTPTVTARPSATPKPSQTQPSFQPSSSAKPTSLPTTSPKPTSSAMPSASPSTCAEFLAPFIVPRLVGTDGSSENDFPEGAISYVSQNSTRATLRITQLWSDENLVWIAPYYIDRGSAEGPFVCPKARNIAPGETLDYSAECFDGEFLFRLIVNDQSLVSGANLTLPDECDQDDDDIVGKQVLYSFLAKCDPTPGDC